MRKLRHYGSLPLLLSCLLLALLFSIAQSVDETGEVHWLQGFAASLPLTPFIVLLFSGVRNLIIQSDSKVLTTSALDRNRLGLSHSRFNKGLVLRRASVLMLLWAPYAFFLYPGVLTFDTSFQLCQFFGNEMPGVFPTPEGYAFTDHHPIMVTLLFGMIVKIGELFGSYNVGFFILSASMGLFTSLSISFCLTVLEGYGVPKAMTRIALLFFGLFPVFPYMVMTPSKDSIFTPLFLIFSVMVIEVAITEGRRFESKRFFLLFLLLACLIPLSKKTGVYIVLLCCVVLALLCRKHRFRFLIAGIASYVFCSVLVPSVLFPLLDVSSGSKVEMMGPLYQQTARYVSQYDGEIEKDDRDAIDAVLGYDSLSDRYVYSIVDTVIHAYNDVNLSPSGEELRNYLNTYLSLGIKHPLAYIEAFISLEKGWFDPRERMLFAEGDGLLLDPPNGRPAIQRSSMGQQVASFPGRVISVLQQVPGLDILFTPLLYTALIPAICALLIVGSRKGLVLLPLLTSLLFLLLSPVSVCSQNIEAMRYLLPFVFLAPVNLIICSVVFLDTRKRQREL